MYKDENGYVYLNYQEYLKYQRLTEKMNRIRKKMDNTALDLKKEEEDLSRQIGVLSNRYHDVVRQFWKYVTTDGNTPTHNPGGTYHRTISNLNDNTRTALRRNKILISYLGSTTLRNMFFKMAEIQYPEAVAIRKEMEDIKAKQEKIQEKIKKRERKLNDQMERAVEKRAKIQRYSHYNKTNLHANDMALLKRIAEELKLASQMDVGDSQ